MTIVTNRGPRRKSSKKPAKPAEIAVPRIVKHPSKWERQEAPLVSDPEAMEEIIQFFERLGMKRARDILGSK